MNVRLKILVLGFLFTGKILFAQMPYVNYTITPNDTICPTDTVLFLVHDTPGHGCEWTCCGGYNFTNGGGTTYLWGTDSLNGTGGGGITFHMHFSGPGVYTYTLTPYPYFNPSTHDSIVTIVVLPNTASVTLTANPPDSLCVGGLMSFTATPTNGGTNPIYQWQVNSVNVGTNSPYFSSSTLN